MVGAEHVSQTIQNMPKADLALDQSFVLFLDNGEPAANRRFELHFEDGAIVQGRTDANGDTGLRRAAFPGRYRLRVLGPAQS